MNKILSIIAIFISFNCYSQSNSEYKTMIGQWKYSDEINEYMLILNNDFTYIFQDKGDFIINVSQGKWKLNGEKIILNSYKQKPPETIITSHYNKSIKGVRFFIKNIYGTPISYLHFILKYGTETMDTTIMNFNEEGMYAFNSINGIKKFEIEIIGLKKAKLRGIKNKNQFEIIMAPAWENYIYMRNEKWKITNKGLYAPINRTHKKNLKNNRHKNYFIKVEN